MQTSLPQASQRCQKTHDHASQLEDRVVAAQHVTDKERDRPFLSIQLHDKERVQRSVEQDAFRARILAAKPVAAAHLNLADHNLPEAYILRVRMPSGYTKACHGIMMLFFRPGTVPLHERLTLVRGSDTGDRLLDAGLTGKDLCVLDYYFYSTDIPYRKGSPQPRNAPFTKADATFANSPEAAVEMWNLLTSAAKEIWLGRAVQPGVEVVFGKPVQHAYTQISENAEGCSCYSQKSRVWMPGYSDENGTFEAGEYPFEWKLFYRLVDGAYEFGKLAIHAYHPCYPGVIRKQPCGTTSQGWQNGLFTGKMQTKVTTAEHLWDCLRENGRLADQLERKEQTEHFEESESLREIIAGLRDEISFLKKGGPSNLKVVEHALASSTLSDRDADGRSASGVGNQNPKPSAAFSSLSSFKPSFVPFAAHSAFGSTGPLSSSSPRGFTSAFAGPSALSSGFTSAFAGPSALSSSAFPLSSAHAGFRAAAFSPKPAPNGSLAPVGFTSAVAMSAGSSSANVPSIGKLFSASLFEDAAAGRQYQVRPAVDANAQRSAKQFGNFNIGAGNAPVGGAHGKEELGFRPNEGNANFGFNNRENAIDEWTSSHGRKRGRASSTTPAKLGIRPTVIRSHSPKKRARAGSRPVQGPATSSLTNPTVEPSISSSTQESVTESQPLGLDGNANAVKGKGRVLRSDIRADDINNVIRENENSEEEREEANDDTWKKGNMSKSIQNRGDSQDEGDSQGESQAEASSS